MVNGKPTLTFGDNQYAVPARAQQRADGNKARNAKAAGGFESYLPVAEYSTQAKGQQKKAAPAPVQAAVPAGTRADAGLRPGQPLPTMTGFGQGGLAQPAARSLQSPLAGYHGLSYAEGANPAGRIGSYQGSPQLPAQPRQKALPPDGNSRIEARGYAQSTMESFSNNRELASQGARLSQKNGQRIAGRPIPGRYDFGMVDTRKNAAKRNAAPGKSGQVLPAGNPARSQPLGMGQNVDARHAARAGKAGRNQGGQSFISHGFGGGNAEALLRDLGYDVREIQPAATYARRLDSETGVAVGSAGRYTGFAGNEDGARTAVMTASHRKKQEAQIAASYPGGSLVHSFYNMAGNGLGALAAKFESGSEGISAIGFDRKGGTSYGKYQISSRAGTMAAFIDYLDEKAPDLAKRLRASGPANTGGRSGRMPAEWKRIAAAEPARFEKLQEDFIRTSHFEPAMRSIAESTGLGFSNMPAALREVLFSTAVQHGPLGAVRIFNQALNNVGVNKLQPAGQTVTESFKRAGRQLIRQVYALRAGQFSSSTSGVQAAVRSRLNQEMNEALGMLA